MPGRNAARVAPAAPAERKTIRTYTASRRDLLMLQAVATYHGLSKSGTITSLVRREFWRLFPAGTAAVRPDRGARVHRRTHAD